MTKVDNFLDEIRGSPKFAAAAATDPKWIEQVDAIERGLNAVDRVANEDPAILEIFDEIQTAISRADLSLKQRLLEVVRLITEVRDLGRKVN
jgi:hypothetical protein